MNRHEFSLYVGNGIHIIIWIYLFFAWCLLFWNAKIAKIHIVFILLVALPLVYVVQSLPCHAILLAKMNYIQKHRRYFRSLPRYPFDRVDQHILQNIALALKWDLAKVQDLMTVVKSYEDDLYIPKLITAGKQLFEGRSFLNPLTPQGMIIIGYVINVTAYWIRWGS
jgi:hypothetical protein